MSDYGMTRREVLFLASAAMSSTIGGTVIARQKVVQGLVAVDHLLLGVSDLDRGITWAEKNLGVTAIAGGSHPGRGTRNALISLAGKRYLEIIAPDPAQRTYNFQIDVRGLNEPRLITWAANTADLNLVAKRAREAAYQVFGPNDGSRARPDGKLLKWKSLGIMNQLGKQGVEPIPFFIEWAPDSVHPAEDSPKGCELEVFEIEHPNPADVSSMLAKLGIDVKVTQASEPRLVATLKSPKGRLRL